MKKVIASLGIFAATALFAFAGTEYVGKTMRQTTAPEECWYGDTEWNVSLWGTYAFAQTDQGHIGAPGFVLGDDLGDRYLQADHAWGGGGDVKFFFAKYFGIGVEGFGLDAKRTEFDFVGDNTGAFVFTKTDDDRLVGGALGTLTIRYPIGCSRFAPYVFGGFGGIFGGGERDKVVGTGLAAPAFVTEHHDSKSELMGQVGGGFEVRFTRHIGWINDFSWNFIDGPNNNFGMVRTGVNFAF